VAEGPDESQKTEEPTQKRLDDARKKGDVAKSQEIPGWFVLAGGLALMSFLLPPMVRQMATNLSVFLAQPQEFSLEPSAMTQMAQDLFWQTALAVSLPISTLAVAGFAGHYVQTGFIFSADKIQPKISKLNPISGFKRIFGPEGIVNFLKGLGKMALISLAAFVVLFPKRDQLAILPATDISTALALVRQAGVELLVAALVVYAVIAALDYAFQRQTFMKRNRMSRQEIKDEVKQSDGDPLIKAKLRQVRHERAQRRMMAKVPEATVIVTNPTHYAVALYYVQGETPAPICVAKGMNETALRIRELGKENSVPIVEDPPLARALHASAELDEEIPLDHFQAVAKLIGYVLSLSRGSARYQPTGTS